jgi:hypothetical protein
MRDLEAVFESSKRSRNAETVDGRVHKPVGNYTNVVPLPNRYKILGLPRISGHLAGGTDDSLQRQTIVSSVKYGCPFRPL